MYIFSVFFLFIVTVFLYIYHVFRKSYKFFEDAGIPYIKPQWIFGNMKDVLLFRKSLLERYQELYHHLDPHPYAGVFLAHKPSVMIRDPDLIKAVLVKDFAYFHDRMIAGICKKTEPIANQISMMKGDEWRNLRIKLTSTFSSGKMKFMFPTLLKCSEGIKTALEKVCSDSEGFEVKDLCSRYTTDVIGNCAFGMETHSLENPDSEFRKMGKRVLSFRWQTMLRMFFPNIPNNFIKIFGLRFFEREVSEYFTNIVKDAVKHREQNNITRGDFLDLLIALKNNTELEKLKNQNDDKDLIKFMSQIGDKVIKSKIDMTIETMTAQSFLFFLAGFDPTATTLSFLLFELSQNQQIQEKLRQEIISTLETNDGILTYAMLKKMPYLDMVVAETLRKWPLGLIMRICNQNYKIPDSNVIIKEGTEVIISAQGLHSDKKYFEKPDEFYPEHFTEEAKAARPHYAYLPFGEGPRNCIAERFAKMMVKVGTIYFLKDFSFVLSPKTKLPLDILPSFGNIAVKNGIWLKCELIHR
uniref:Cytochrome P450 6PZ5 n=1 Tax=Phenacoccus solenopsis TaxID=483260 RepID=A0A5P1JZ32_9HEMI|nr:cytochrome P450 6PZ5 [Phenacoccus solenopsis]